MEGIEWFRRLADNRYAEAKKWKASGGKVVGYLSGGVPEEIIMAAGLFPVRLAGDIYRPTPLADEYMEFNFDPIVRSLYDMLLAGEFAFRDMGGEFEILAIEAAEKYDVAVPSHTPHTREILSATVDAIATSQQVA